VIVAPLIEEKISLAFDDVNLLDGPGKVRSRSQVDLSVKINDRLDMKLPILAASMDTLNSIQMGAALMEMGAGQVYHRYCTIDQRVMDCYSAASLHNRNMQKDSALPYGINGAAVGLYEDPEEVERIIVDGLVDLISIDVAACYHADVFLQIRFIGEICSEMGIPLMVGNFSNPKFIHDLVNSDAGEFVRLVKVGQGGGSCCSTRIKTGIGKPTFQAVADVYEEVKKFRSDLLIVADGGIRTSGDIVKAIGAGADLVMLGGMLAGHDECPMWVEKDGEKMFRFRGMASEEAKRNQFDELKNIEGVSTLVKSKGPVANTLKDIKEGVQSGIATAGFESVAEFKGNGHFVRVTSSGVNEARPHILG
jgi:IMP dehydrogenase